MSVQITVNGIPEVLANIQGIQSQLTNMSEGMLEAAGDTLAPAITDASTSVWGVRTGEYSEGWEMEAAGPNTIEITNDVDHALPLEYGWTTRNGSSVMSPGVAIPAIEGAIDDFAEALGEWLTSQSG